MATRRSIWVLLLALPALGSDAEPPMLPPERMSGVMVLAFEERSFFPRASARPDTNDPWRFVNEIMIARDDLERLGQYAHPDGTAFHLTFIGRRSREPDYSCNGIPYFSFEAKQLLSVRYLGAMGDYDSAGMGKRMDRLAARLRGTGGAAQAKAIARCEARDAAGSGG
ncbi:MAG TPA: hypothetical protein VGB62_04405 [Allosphingosinicella sp.]|jgi:hypothetical protein